MWRRSLAMVWRYFGIHRACFVVSRGVVKVLRVRHDCTARSGQRRCTAVSAFEGVWWG